MLGAGKFYDRGLINWSPKSPYHNTIHLCPNCHDSIQYCDINDPPSLIIPPSPQNLQYLIDFKKQNRRDRRRAGVKTGLTPQRKMPTSFEYLTAGGLNKPIELKPYLLAEDVEWGSVSDVRHVFPLMENEELFDKDVRGQLQELYSLYFDDEVDERDDKCDELTGDKRD
ncbi:hypothetical protein DPV78_012111 [Talaromyces pinophilus]|nr:hypothetical protein DPV78_012111 [Talaromyces pinophilus]